jgi:hypothetical protein
MVASITVYWRCKSWNAYWNRSVSARPTFLAEFDLSDRFGNKYFENLNPDDEVPGL